MLINPLLLSVQDPNAVHVVALALAQSSNSLLFSYPDSYISIRATNPLILPATRRLGTAADAFKSQSDLKDDASAQQDFAMLEVNVLNLAGMDLKGFREATVQLEPIHWWSCNWACAQWECNKVEETCVQGNEMEACSRVSMFLLCFNSDRTLL